MEKKIPKGRLVVGLSGGSDSTLVLLIACHLRKINPNYKVIAVHCIHGLDADDPIWLNHCQNLCKEVQVDEFISPKLNIIYAKGVSPEEASRDERYKALLSNLKGGTLMLGHQADDEVENLLLALKRGSGPEGLSGMKELVEDRRGRIVRPLLYLHKKEIEDILKALGFNFVFDISNTYLKFERNFLRLEVLPLLRTRFLGIDESILRSAKLCSLEHDLALRYIEPLIKKYVCEYRTYKALNLDGLDLQDESLMTMLIREFLTRSLGAKPEYTQVYEGLNFARGSLDTKACLKLNSNFELRRYQNFLLVVKKFKEIDKQKFVLDVNGSIVNGDFIYSFEKTSDPSKAINIKPFEKIVLNFCYKGSMRLKPRQRNHSREIKKLMGEYGIPPWERSKMCLIENEEGKILGLGDLFATLDKVSEGFCLKITPR